MQATHAQALTLAKISFKMNECSKCVDDFEGKKHCITMSVILFDAWFGGKILGTCAQAMMLFN